MNPQGAINTLRNIIHAYVPNGEEYQEALVAVDVLERYRNPDSEALAALVRFVVDLEHDARRALDGLQNYSARAPMSLNR